MFGHTHGNYQKNEALLAENGYIHAIDDPFSFQNSSFKSKVYEMTIGTTKWWALHVGYIDHSVVRFGTTRVQVVEHAMTAMCELLHLPENHESLRRFLQFCQYTQVNADSRQKADYSRSSHAVRARKRPRH
tara:strand:- start:166 stop:558 length:393 start_codon:yes stop_codon:yes gene_type:complete